MTTLTIKNETGEELIIETGGAPVKIPAGGSAKLSDKELNSRAFAAALEAGKISFANVPNPGPDEIDLARKVLPPLVASMRDRLGKFKNQFEQSQKDLLRQRDSFNKTWNVAETRLGAVQSAPAGWAALKQAVKNLLLDTNTEDPAVTNQKKAIKKLEDVIGKLRNEDLAQTNRSREEWYAERIAKEQELKQAQNELAKLSAEKADPLAADVATLDATVTAVAALKKDKAIGKPIAEFGQ
jgi:hypothetical protein